MIKIQGTDKWVLTFWPEREEATWFSENKPNLIFPCKWVDGRFIARSNLDMAWGDAEEAGNRVGFTAWRAVNKNYAKMLMEKEVEEFLTRDEI